MAKPLTVFMERKTKILKRLREIKRLQDEVSVMRKAPGRLASTFLSSDDVSLEDFV